MTTVKADRMAADRVLTRACDKTVRLIRAGSDPRDYVPVLTAAVITAGVLLEARP